jgi:hypothetical protein
MGVLMEDVIKAGALLGGGGLKPSSLGARLRVVDGLGERAVHEAVEFAKRWLVIHAKVGATDSEIEIRELMDATGTELSDVIVLPEDCGPMRPALSHGT